MAWTQTDIDNLQAAIGQGVKVVKYGDKETVYQDLNQMIALLDVMRAEVNGTPTIQARRRMGIFRSTLNGCWPNGWW